MISITAPRKLARLPFETAASGLLGAALDQRWGKATAPRKLARLPFETAASGLLRAALDQRLGEPLVE